MSVYVAGNLIWMRGLTEPPPVRFGQNEHNKASFVHMCIYMGQMQAILQAIKYDLITLPFVPRHESRVSVVYYTSVI